MPGKKDKTGITFEMALLVFLIACIVVAAVRWFILENRPALQRKA
jgi:hypothetical protein